MVEEDLQPYDLYTADEVFLSSANPCVLPATRVDKRQVGEGEPGPITRQRLAEWSKTVGVDIVQQAQRFAEKAAAEVPTHDPPGRARAGG